MASLSNKGVTRLTRAVRLGIRLITLVLPVLFAWLSFKDLSFKEIVQTVSNSTTQDVLWKLTMLIYYSAWVVGASIDTNLHEDVAVHAPFDGRLPLKALAMLALFLVLAALLLYSQTYEQFVLFFTLFFGLNLWGGNYINQQFSRPMIDKSRAQYATAGDHFGIERTRIFERYQLGRWQKVRFLVGCLIIGAMIAIAAANRFYGGQVPVLKDLPIEVVQLVGMLSFVIILETWIFYMRIRTLSELAAIDRLSEHYQLRPL